MDCCEYGTRLLECILEAFSAKLIGRNQVFGEKNPEATKNSDCRQTSRNN
jgi:hypothetical protein